MHLPPYLCILFFFLLGFETLAEPQCDVPVTDPSKMACQQLIETEDDCYEKGCCYKGHFQDSTTPWCFYPVDQVLTCAVADKDKTQCYLSSSNEKSCEDHRCCYELRSKSSGVPSCFIAEVLDTTTPYTTSTTTTATTSSTTTISTTTTTTTTHSTTPSTTTACTKVTSSECSRDEPDIVAEHHLDSETECQLLCDTYSTVPTLGCTFSAWSPFETANCRLYREHFWRYISHCNVLAGPTDLSGCDVKHPEDNSCEVYREGDCSYDGNVLEIQDNVDSWEFCKDFCLITAGCKTWTFQSEPSLQCRLYESDTRRCHTSYSPSGVDLSLC